MTTLFEKYDQIQGILSFVAVFLSMSIGFAVGRMERSARKDG